MKAKSVKAWACQYKFPNGQITCNTSWDRSDARYYAGEHMKVIRVLISEIPRKKRKKHDR